MSQIKRTWESYMRSWEWATGLLFISIGAAIAANANPDEPLLLQRFYQAVDSRPFWATFFIAGGLTYALAAKSLPLEWKVPTRFSWFILWIWVTTFVGVEAWQTLAWFILLAITLNAGIALYWAVQAWAIKEREALNGSK